MNNLYRVLLTGVLLVTGLLGAMSGEYIVSSALFAASTFIGSMGASHKQSKD